MRLSFHPDQFVVPGSASAGVVAASLRELEYQAEVAELVAAEQGGKQASLARLATNLGDLSRASCSRLVLESDDRVFTVEDLLPLCERLDLPLVYDVLARPPAHGRRRGQGEEHAVLRLCRWLDRAEASAASRSAARDVA